MLRKHVAKYVMQWDQYIRGVVWAYHNTPHSSPSFLLFGFDCHSPTETAFLPARTKSLRATDVGDYQEQMVLSSTTRSLAIKANKEAQYSTLHS